MSFVRRAFDLGGDMPGVRRDGGVREALPRVLRVEGVRIVPGAREHGPALPALPGDPEGAPDG